MKRIDQKELRRREILTKALELFVERGYAGTKTSDITKELGISEGLLFHYFKSKEKIYMELVKMGVEGTEVFSMVEEDPYNAIYNVINDFFIRAKENRIVAKMFILVDRAQNKASTPESVYEIATKVNIVYSTISIIKLGQEQGVFRKGDPLTLSYTFWCAIQGVMEELARNSEMDIPDPHWIMAILKE